MPVWGAGMERDLFRYIWRNSWRDQLPVLVVVALLCSPLAIGALVLWSAHRGHVAAGRGRADG